MPCALHLFARLLFHASRPSLSPICCVSAPLSLPVLRCWRACAWACPFYRYRAGRLFGSPAGRHIIFLRVALLPPHRAQGTCGGCVGRWWPFSRHRQPSDPTSATTDTTVDCGSRGGFRAHRYARALLPAPIPPASIADVAKNAKASSITHPPDSLYKYTTSIYINNSTPQFQYVSRP